MSQNIFQKEVGTITGNLSSNRLIEGNKKLFQKLILKIFMHELLIFLISFSCNKDSDLLIYFF